MVMCDRQVFVDTYEFLKGHGGSTEESLEDRSRLLYKGSCE
jgi:hypothetical protein